MANARFGKVAAIWRYPVSSFSGEKLSQAHLTHEGLDGDRRFGIFDDETGELLKPARKQWSGAPRLQAGLDKNEVLRITTDGQHWYRVGEDGLQAELSRFFGRSVTVVPYGADFAGKPAINLYRLAPIHLLSRQSIEFLRRLLPDSEIDERRFRPNILVDHMSGCDDEVPEYRLLNREFTVGGLRLRGTRKCGRCSFTTLQQFGIPEDRNVLRALIQHFDKDFGIYCDVVEGGVLAVGDELVLDEKAMEPPPIVIVGAGQAGGTLARALREFGYGGAIDMFGEEAHLPYERPPLSKRFASASEEGAVLAPVLSAEDVRELGIRLHIGERVVHVDRAAKTVETADGASHPYAHLVLATGGSARRVPLLNHGFGRIHSIRTADDAERLRRSLKHARKIFVLGGGWLGLEVAAAAREVGIEVEFFVRQTNLCARVLPRVVADFLQQAHERNGVRFHMGTEPSFTEQWDHVEAHFDGVTQKADLMVVAIGINANDHLARRAGLECRNGILTAEDGATRDPSVFAVGDVSLQVTAANPEGMRIESWQNANEQAMRAARAIMGAPSAAPAVPRFWSDQYDLNIQIVGMPNSAAVPLRMDGTTQPFWEFESFAIGINRPRDVHDFAASRAMTRNDDDRSKEPSVEAESDTYETDSGPTTRLPLCSVVDAEQEELRKFDISPIGEIVLIRLGGGYFAMRDKCPHADASLSEGFLEGRRIVCPLHFAEFDVINGTAHNAPRGCANAKTYQVEVLDDWLHLIIPA